MRIMPACILAILLASTASAREFGADPHLSSWRFVAGGEGPYFLAVRPDGLGAAFDAAVDADGHLADATIEVTVRDGLGVPVPGYPASQIWIAPLSGPIPMCSWNYPARGWHPDADTDASGVARFSLSPRCGGWGSGDMAVHLLEGTVSGGVVPMRWASADLSGDLEINLSDTGMFALDLVSGYAFRADLDFDGFVNLSDAGRLVRLLGRSCYTGP
ncbi:MAG TPA: hypothetical protein PLQ13_05995 [Candidatus Krumholzibacteria bacterium]|nr:hypothetical protein [Candidatus Krumholzibacteria bacterium]